MIEAQMDTRNFLGLKSTILYVTLVTASGREAEVRLGVTSNILADIVLNPGSLDFGTVMKGQTPSQVLTIDRIGAPGLAIRAHGVGQQGAHGSTHRDSSRYAREM